MTSRKDAREAGVVLIGCGKMGAALGAGLVESGAVGSDRLRCCDRESERARQLAEETGAEAVEPAEAFEAFSGLERRLFVVAVKPKDVQGVLEEGRSRFGPSDTVISIAAGVPTDSIAEWAGEEPDIVRAMPNTPALVGRGITGIYAPASGDSGTVRRIFEGVGRVVELRSESDFDALTGVSGSGPAYIFTAIEALADGAVRAGLDRETSVELAMETIFGAAALARSREVHTAELKDEVASPGGTTIAGLSELERRGFRSALIEAVRTAAEKSREMSDDVDDN